MNSRLIEKRRAAIRRHLFLLCPNNSGSTYLSRALATSPNVWSMANEGQHMIGFAGPSTMQSRWPLLWASSDEALSYFRDSPDYDWERTSKAWYFHATAKRDDAPIFHTKAPPFLAIADQLAAHFLKPQFLLMVRNPYAALEGILRHWKRSEAVVDQDRLPLVGAAHLMKCFELQQRNIETLDSAAIHFTYEQLCADPQAIATRIEAFIPDLGTLDLAQKIAVKGAYNEPLRNMNADQIQRLSADDIAKANSVFERYADLMSYFDYKLIEDPVI